MLSLIDVEGFPHARAFFGFVVLTRKHIVLLAGWILAIAVGIHILLSYKGKPGNPGRPPSQWVQNELVSHSSTRPVLIMFAHPRCPCTEASLGELEQLLASAKSPFDAIVLFYEPRGGSKTWSSTGLIKQARSIPGVKVAFDEEANLARRFGVETSGHTLLYDTEGRLLYSGGLTGSRGHLGDNAGYEAILSMLTNRSSQAQKNAPVFGCELFNQCTRNLAGRN